METYLLVVGGLFLWAAMVFFVIAYNDWNDLVGVFVTLLGYVVLAESVGLSVPATASGELIGRLLEFTFTYYGVIGIVALVCGVAVGRSYGLKQRPRG